VRLAVYTTLYPAMLPWLEEWQDSLCRQTDPDFVLWIGLDGLRPEQVEHRLRIAQPICWIPGHPGETPATVRNRALSALVRFCDAVVLVDSDDRLLPTRVEAARAALLHADLAGCALRLIDADGRPLGREFSPLGLAPECVLPRRNLFGFSNSAIRTSLLVRCLPVPPETVLMDWMVATRAWLAGATLSFDPVPRMEYRRYSANTARVSPSLQAAQVVSDTALVAAHFRLMLATLRPGYLRDRVNAFREVASDLDRFQQEVVRDSARLHAYVDAFNADPPQEILWWSTVARPSLSFMWNSRNEEELYENNAVGKH